MYTLQLTTSYNSQKHHRLDASCGFYRPDAICQQVVSSLLTLSSCIKSINIRLAATLYLLTCCKLTKQLASNLAACSSQLAASLLTTCNRLVIIKPEQAMRTHPDIGLVIADLLQLARFWLCIFEIHQATCNKENC